MIHEDVASSQWFGPGLDPTQAAAFGLRQTGGGGHQSKTIIRETIGAIDELATHHSIDAVEVNDAAVVALGPKDLKYEVSGRLSVTLQWGSGSDLSRDMGATSTESFPFTISMTAPVDAPHDFQDASYSIDMRGWYGEDYELAEVAEEDFG